MKKTVKRLKYCIIISLIIISQFFSTMSYASKLNNIGNDFQKITKVTGQSDSQNNYQVLKAAEELNDNEFEEWCNSMIDLCNIALPDKQVASYGTVAYNMQETTSYSSYYGRAYYATSEMVADIYKMADLDDYFNNDKLFGVIDLNKTKQIRNRVEKYRAKLLNNYSANGLGDVQKYVESAKLTYQVAAKQGNRTFPNINDLKKYEKSQIDNYYKRYGYNYPTTNTTTINEIENIWKNKVGTNNMKQYAADVISGAADKKQGATADDVNDLDEATQKKLEGLVDVQEYKHPDVTEKKDSSDNKDDMDMDNTIKNADAFVNKKGEDGNPENNINTEDLKDFFNPLYNITLVIGIIVAVLVGAVLGVKFLTGSVEQKADTKKLLIPYLAGCVAVFGAFGIWKLVVTILAEM